MSDAITFTKLRRDEGDYERPLKTMVFEEFEIDRDDIVAVERDEYDPNELLQVYIDDGRVFSYALLEKDDEIDHQREEEQEWLLAFSVSSVFASRTY